MKLKEIVKLNAGLVVTRKKYTVKDKVFNKTKYRYKLLGLGAVDELGNIDMEKVEEFISSEELSKQYLTKKGDILVRTNYPYTAILIDETSENMVIPSYYIKIEKRNANFLNGYLVWYLNSEKVKREFIRSQSGVTIPSINQRNLGDIKIPRKNLKDQELISNIYSLLKREKNLIRDLEREKERYYRGLNQQILNKGE